jgi:hypothetical protein
LKPRTLAVNYLRNEKKGSHSVSQNCNSNDIHIHLLAFRLLCRSLLLFDDALVAHIDTVQKLSDILLLHMAFL